MTRFLTIAATAGALALVSVAAPTTADARCRGCGVAAGVIGGIAAGAAIAGAASGYGGYYGYGPGYYGYDYAPGYAYAPAYAYDGPYAYGGPYYGYPGYGYYGRRWGWATSDYYHNSRMLAGTR